MMRERKDYQIETTCASFRTALRRFTKKFPEVAEVWSDSFEWMYENGKDTFSDIILADGTRNDDWRYSLILDEQAFGETKTHYYLCVIERS